MYVEIVVCIFYCFEVKLQCPALRLAVCDLPRLACAVYDNVEMVQLPSSAVREIVCASPVFDEMLRRDIENQSADALLLVLQLHEKLPALSSPLVPESGNFQDLFEPSHLAKLVPCLKVRPLEYMLHS